MVGTVLGIELSGVMVFFALLILLITGSAVAFWLGARRRHGRALSGRR